MRVLRTFFILLLLFCISCISVSADSEKVGEDILSDFYDTLPEGSEELSENGELISKVGIDAFLSEIFSAFSEGGGEIFSFLSLLFGIAVLFILADNSAYAFSGLGGAVLSGVAVIGSLAVFLRISPLIDTVREGLSELSAFFSSVMPVFSAINVASGNMNTASVQGFNMTLTLSAVGYGANAVLFPMTLSLFALALIGSIGSGTVASAAKSIKGIFNWLLGIGTAVIIGAVSLQSILASSADAAYLRAAKYAASGIPIVGSTVSGALSTLAGGLGYVKSTVGVGSVAVILSLALSPLVMLLLYRLSFSLCISFLDLFGCAGGVRCFSAFRTAFDGVISIYALSAVIYIFEIIVFMKGGVTVFG